MRFSTQIPTEQEADITYNSKIMMFGSCFSENIGNKLRQLKFDISNNPLGILFNPCSIRDTILRITEHRHLESKDLFHKEGVWNSFCLHSKFARLSEEEYLRNANKQIDEALLFLQSATHIFITLGTAWIYEITGTGNVAANCHKEPPQTFTRKRLSVEACVEALSDTIKNIRAVNPDINITFTVSPIRHWKDGAHGNQISKSTLLLAIEEIQQQDPSIHYFPSYEIMMDELRDYRFYAEDMLHPSEQAIQYIWEKFTGSRITQQTADEMSEVGRIIDAANHRAFNPQSKSYRTFKAKTLEAIIALEKRLPQLNFSEEKGKIAQ